MVTGINKCLGTVVILTAWLWGCTPPPVNVEIPPRGPLPDAGVADPCAAADCAVLGAECVEDDSLEVGFRCVCPSGQHPGAGGICTADPCEPNPCTEVRGKSICSAVDGLAVCSCDPENFDPDGDGCLERIREVSPADDQLIDWSQPNPTFTARLRLTDHQNLPVFRAAVTLGEETRETDLAGRVHFDDLSANQDHMVRFEADGFAPVTKLVNAVSSGLREYQLRMKPLLRRAVFQATDAMMVRETSAKVQIPPSSFVTPSGAPAEGEVTVEVTTVDPATDSVTEGPGDMIGVDASGQAVPLESGGMIYIRATDATGRELQLADSQQAVLSFRVPADFEGEVGETKALWSFDEETNRWREEGECELMEITERGAQVRICEGPVAHFSWWNLDHPTQQTCIDYRNIFELGTTYRYLSADRRICPIHPDNPTCRTPLTGYESTFEVSAPYHRNYCALLYNLNQDLRLVIELTVEEMVDDGHGNPVPVERTFMILDTIPRAGLTPVTMSGGHSPAEVCGDARACNHLPQLTITAETLAAAFAHDGDGDGYFRYADEARNSDPAYAESVDCDDNDFYVHPGLNELPYNDKDDNCDGEILQAYHWQDFFPDDPDGWHELCAMYGPDPEGEELFGNDFDENCDGVIGDADDDTFVGLDYPEDLALPDGYGRGDCNDDEPTAHPGASEVFGTPELPNYIDEDCDGLALDQDGDGHFHPDHFRPGGDETYPYDDCNDWNADVYPLDETLQQSDPARYAQLHAAKIRLERGQLNARFYSWNDAIDNWQRGAEFCEHFDRNGAMKVSGWQLLRDYNCDGIYTDLDGDDWTQPGDTNLDEVFGELRGGDCNDLDPRVHPVVAPPDPDTAAECVTIGEIRNLSECTPALDRWGATMRDPCPRLPSSIPTYCVDLVEGPDQTPTGHFVCAAGGWNQAIPPRPYERGELWGPCGGPLGGCSAESSCAGPMPYTDDYVAELETRFSLSLTNPATFGMCFPRCGNVCRPNPCPQQNRQYCRVQNRAADCTCYIEYRENQETGACETVCEYEPCEAPNQSLCVPLAPAQRQCMCEEGYVLGGDGCVVDPTGGEEPPVRMLSRTSTSPQQMSGAVPFQISSDGHKVIFLSKARGISPGHDGEGDYPSWQNHLYEYDVETDQISWVIGGVSMLGSRVASDDHRYLAFGRINQAVWFDRETGQEQVVSVNQEGTVNQSTAGSITISPDGTKVVFALPAQFDAEISGLARNLFLRDVVAGTTTRITVAHDGGQANGDSERPSWSGDGRFIAFDTRADNLSEHQSGPHGLFLYDTQTSTLEPLLRTQDPPTVAVGTGPALSADGGRVAFTAGGNVYFPEAEGYHVCVLDRASGVVLDASPPAVLTGGYAGHPTISGDGRYVAFYHGSPDLVPGDTTAGLNDLFVRDLQEGRTARILTVLGLEPNGDTQRVYLSADGRTLAFSSAASNLVANDINATVPDAFIAPNPLIPPDPGELRADLVASRAWTFAYAPPGQFSMGSPVEEGGRDDDETPRVVTLTRGFWVKQHEVTQAEWQAVAAAEGWGETPSFFDNGEDSPVEDVSWFEALAFVNAMSRDAGLDECYVLTGCTGTPGGGCDPGGSCVGDYSCSDVTFAGLDCDGYRLPTEAEWEYAARAGTTTAFYNGDITYANHSCGNDPGLDALAWYCDNATGPGVVGTLAANSWNLKDVLGNVLELVWDYHEPYDPTDLVDPLGADSGSSREIRGGSWINIPKNCRTADRGAMPEAQRYSTVGFRPVRTR